MRRPTSGRAADCSTSTAARLAVIARRPSGGCGPSPVPRALARPPRVGTPPGSCVPILEPAWLASDQLSGKLLRAPPPGAAHRVGHAPWPAVAPAVRAALTAASAATLDRLLRPLRRRRPRQPGRVAPALTPLRAQVPLRTWREWTGVAPGALQGDLVLHCGESTAGQYCATLVAVDVATTWTELQPIWGLHQQRVTGGIQYFAQRLPFPLREWHSDNGSEFVNACLLGWCQRHRVRFTRGRPYRKNDQAWVEQRNGLLVRRLVGYDRYSSRAAWAVLQRLYGLLRLQHNFFRPVRKLLSKHRVGSKIRKRYDRPRRRPSGCSRRASSPPEQQPRPGAATPGPGSHRPGARHPADPRRPVETRRYSTPPVRRPPMGNRILRPRPRRSVTPLSEAPRKPARRRRRAVRPARSRRGGPPRDVARGPQFPRFPGPTALEFGLWRTR